MQGASHLQISGVILAQGFETSDPFHHLLLDRLVKTLAPLVAEVIVAVQNPADLLKLDALLVKAHGAPPTCLSALHAGLFHACRLNALAVGLETPLVCRDLLQALLERTDPRWDVIAPAPEGVPRPFPTVYATTCHTRLEQMLRQGKNTAEALFKKARMKVVSEKVLRQKDPELISFLNLYQADDRERIRALINALPL